MPLSYEFTEYKRPTGYQCRTSGLYITTGKMRRFCRACNGTIPKGVRHVSGDSHLSSGFVSNINICQNCIAKFNKELSK